MQKYISNNSLYLVGSVKDVVEELKKMASKYDTVQDYINSFLK